MCVCARAIWGGEGERERERNTHTHTHTHTRNVHGVREQTDPGPPISTCPGPSSSRPHCSCCGPSLAMLNSTQIPACSYKAQKRLSRVSDVSAAWCVTASLARGASRAASPNTSMGAALFVSHDALVQSICVREVFLRCCLPLDLDSEIDYATPVPMATQRVTHLESQATDLHRPPTPPMRGTQDLASARSAS